MKFFDSLKRALLKGALYPIFARYVSMPGRSYKGAFRELTTSESQVEAGLRAHVDALANGIGVRHARSGDSLFRASKYILSRFIKAGYAVQIETFEQDGVLQRIVVAELPGRMQAADGAEVIVIGAHYDTVLGSPGADDNASGVAALLEIARLLKDARLDRTVRFIAFPNEETTAETSNLMGSYHYARSCFERGDRIVGMMSLEMLGYFTGGENTQLYPFPFNLFYPSRGNFIAFVGNASSRRWVRKVVGTFRKLVEFPSEGGAAPDRFKDIARSDHWAFWQFGVPGLMVTDTSNFRYPHLHSPEDTPDKIDFASMARITSGLARVIAQLARV